LCTAANGSCTQCNFTTKLCETGFFCNNTVTYDFYCDQQCNSNVACPSW
jgi:hypothetical protein